MSIQEIHRTMYNAIVMAAAEDLVAQDAGAQRDAADLGVAKQLHSCRASYKFLEDWLDEPGLASKQVLDFGCGMGDLSIYFASQGARVTSVDIFDQAIGLTRANAAAYPLAEQPVFQFSDVEGLEGSDAVFDCTSARVSCPTSIATSPSNG